MLYPDSQIGLVVLSPGEQLALVGDGGKVVKACGDGLHANHRVEDGLPEEGVLQRCRRFEFTHTGSHSEHSIAPDEHGSLL